MTGRGAGFCAGYHAPGFATGGGFGRGMGRGFGFRNRRFAGWNTPAEPASREDQVASLKAQMNQIQQQLDALEHGE
jgi:hypothetical protein